jgi:hypothetical protein
MRSSPRPVERRQFGRRRTCLHATIAPRSRPCEPCIVRDISASGALLEVSKPSLLPSRFRLIVEANGLETDCEVVHRGDTAVGVRFTAQLASSWDGLVERPATS